MRMCNEEPLRAEFLPPAQIVKNKSFLLPVIITNTAETSIEGSLSGTILLEDGLAFKPNQKKIIQFEHLSPGQKIVLTWILFAVKEGIHKVNIHIFAADQVIIKKSTCLVVRS